MPPRNSSSYAVPAVESAISILETLGTAQPMSLTELARKLGMGKSSVYRVLVTLALRGYVEKDPNSDRYQLTYRLFALGSRASERLGLQEIAEPVMRRLGSQTGETVNLGVLDDFRTVSIYLVESTHPLRIHMRIGGVSAQATATGKILLGALEPAELTRRLVNRRLEAITRNTIRSRPALLRELRRVRQLGYAIDDEECSLGLRCVGAPVVDHRGTVVAALSMVAPCHRLPHDKLPAAISLVREAAREISLRLGHTEDSKAHWGGAATPVGRIRSRGGERLRGA